jgi:asparaginyl-tRNA synthetase
MVSRIIEDLLIKNERDLEYFLDEKKINNLADLSLYIQDIPKITFREALDVLYEDTKNDIYKKFSMNGNFGSWEEVRLTEIYNNMVAISQFPLLEVPFYHAMVDNVEEKWTELNFKKTNSSYNHPTSPEFILESNYNMVSKEKSSKVANCADFIWPGYREFIGSGHRVRSISELEEKAEIFDLPRNDYKPYLQSRELPGYEVSSGFGMGWERLVQGLLEMPFIWTASQFPRGHTTLKP